MRLYDKRYENQEIYDNDIQDVISTEHEWLMYSIVLCGDELDEYVLDGIL